MSLKIAYFQPTVVAIDHVPPVEFSKLYSLAEQLHGHPELNETIAPLVNIRGGQQIQVYPNQLNIDVSWLVKWIEQIAGGYMEIISQQTGTEDLRLCKPVVTSIWTIKQTSGDYQELHTHPGGHLSGNIYVTAPEIDENSHASDGQLVLKLPQPRDITKFVMHETWKYAPNPGTVVLFPSHLAHTVHPWKGLGNRTVVSFDVKLEPRSM
jgi:uncharacterized protein (TIGR02466 family)